VALAAAATALTARLEAALAADDATAAVELVHTIAAL
jgi:HPt (histidine-containing phosphotransfer) domain-containing protein